MCKRGTYRIFLSPSNFEAERHLPVRKALLLHDLLDCRQRRRNDLVHSQVDLRGHQEGTEINGGAFGKACAEPGLQTLDGDVVEGGEESREVVGGEVIVVVGRRAA